MPSTLDREILAADGTRHACRVTVASAPPWTLAVDGADGARIETTGSDLFEALVSLRLLLGERGADLLVQGATAGVALSGLQRESSGRMAYRLGALPPGAQPEIVDILAPADPARIVSVAEQAAERAAMRRRVRGAPIKGAA